MRLGISIQLLPLANIKINRERPSNKEESQRHNHSNPDPRFISHVPEDSGDDGAAGNGGDDEGGAALGVATQTAEGEGEDGGEDAGFEEEDDHEHGEAAPVWTRGAAGVDADGGGDEDHDEGLVGEEDVAGFGDVH